MQLLESYLVPPGSCRICTAAVTPVVDCGIPFDSDGFGGAFYVCANCVGNMAGLLGWIPPQRWETVENFNADLLVRLNAAELQAEDLNRTIDSMVRAETARIRRPRSVDKKRTPTKPWTKEDYPGARKEVAP